MKKNASSSKPTYELFSSLAFSHCANSYCSPRNNSTISKLAKPNRWDVLYEFHTLIGVFKCLHLQVFGLITPTDKVHQGR